MPGSKSERLLIVYFEKPNGIMTKHRNNLCHQLFFQRPTCVKHLYFYTYLFNNVFINNSSACAQLVLEFDTSSKLPSFPSLKQPIRCWYKFLALRWHFNPSTFFFFFVDVICISSYSRSSSTQPPCMCLMPRPSNTYKPDFSAITCPTGFLLILYTFTSFFALVKPTG